MNETAMQPEHSNLRERLRGFVEHRRVQGIIITLILVNAALLGLETWPAAMALAGGLIIAVDRAILAVFVVGALLDAVPGLLSIGLVLMVIYELKALLMQKTTTNEK